MSSTKIRIISASIVLAIIISLYIFLEKLGLGILACIATLGAQYEYIRLSFRGRSLFLKSLFAVFALLIFISFSLGFYDYCLLLLALSVMVSSVGVMLAERNSEDNNAKQSFIASFSLGVIYVGVLPAIITQLIMFHDIGVKVFLLGIITVITTDVAAYFCGRKFGRSKLLPSVSPNKTKAGAYAGSIFATITTCVSVYLLDLNAHIVGLTITGLFASIFAQFGDLFESILKRNAGQKDSGSLMPGHGGYLDRLDSILFCFPLFYLYVSHFI